MSIQRIPVMTSSPLRAGQHLTYRAIYRGHLDIYQLDFNLKALLWWLEPLGLLQSKRVINITLLLLLLLSLYIILLLTHQNYTESARVARQLYTK